MLTLYSEVNATSTIINDQSVPPQTKMTVVFIAVPSITHDYGKTIEK